MRSPHGKKARAPERRSGYHEQPATTFVAPVNSNAAMGDPVAALLSELDAEAERLLAELDADIPRLLAGLPNVTGDTS